MAWISAVGGEPTFNSMPKMAEMRREPSFRPQWNWRLRALRLRHSQSNDVTTYNPADFCNREGAVIVSGTNRLNEPAAAGVE